MTELNDHELLAEFARSGSEVAFATLTARHVNLVYSAALRFCGDAQHCEEITQAVFIILARKAGKLSPRVVLSGWLYQAARLTAANFVKGEIRRQRREQEAYMQSTLNETDLSRQSGAAADAAAWQQLAPLLDEAMGRLGETDRNAVVLRFFENKTAAEVAAALKLTEAAAHKRVNRALEKLRKIFSKRGVALSAALIAGAVSTGSVQAAPAGLAATISTVAITKGAAAGGSTLTLVKGALKIMAWTKMKTSIVVGASVLLAAGTTKVAVQQIQTHRTYAWQVKPSVDTAFLKSVPPQVRIVPTKFPDLGSLANYTISDGEREMGIAVHLDKVLEVAYGQPPSRMIYPPAMPSEQYDFIANLPKDSRLALQQELKRKFGLTGSLQMRDTDVLLFKVKTANAPGLRSANGQSGIRLEVGHLEINGQPATLLASMLEGFFHGPIIDRTGLVGSFNFNLNWNPDQGWDAEVVRKAINDQLGLELVPTNMPIEMLVVEKAK